MFTEFGWQGSRMNKPGRRADREQIKTKRKQYKGLDFILHLVLMLRVNFSREAHLSKRNHQTFMFTLNRRLVSHRFKEAIIPIIVQMGL